MRFIALRENNNVIAVIQFLYGLAESGENAGIVINGDSVSIAENAYR